MSLTRRQRGFTLIELLVVIAVIGVLAALLLPAVQQARARARTAQCLNNFKQIGLGLQNYESTYTTYPPSFVRQEDGNPPPPGPGGSMLQYRCHWTGFHMLLPYLDQEALYNQYDFDGTWLSSMTDSNDRSSWLLNRTPIPALLCPSAKHKSLIIGEPGIPGSTLHWMSSAPSDYSFSHGMDIIKASPGSGEENCPGGLLHYWQQTPSSTRGAFGYNSTCRAADMTDGSSQTFVLGEKSGGRLTFGSGTSSFPVAQVEFPWAMAAVRYFAPTGASASEATWAVGPFAVTRDLRLPNCPDSPTSSGVPFPMNPLPTRVPASATERPLYSFQSEHTGGAYFLFGDGNARFLSETINQSVFEAISTISGNETVSLE